MERDISRLYCKVTYECLYSEINREGGKPEIGDIKTIKDTTFISAPYKTLYTEVKKDLAKRGLLFVDLNILHVEYYKINLDEFYYIQSAIERGKIQRVGFKDEQNKSNMCYFEVASDNRPTATERMNNRKEVISDLLTITLI